MKTLLGWFWRGCLVLAPLAVTLYVAYVVVATVDSMVPVGFPGLGLLVAVVLVTFAGFMSTNVIGTAVMRWAEHAMSSLPFVKLVYSSIRDLVQAFAGNKRSFNRPVLFSLAPGGPRVLGFLTRERLDVLGLDDHVAVYVPQSYNFAGNLVLVKRDQVVPVDASSPEVLAFIVSGGVAGLGVESALSEKRPKPTRQRTILGMGPFSRR